MLRPLAPIDGFLGWAVHAVGNLAEHHGKRPFQGNGRVYVVSEAAALRQFLLLPARPPRPPTGPSPHVHRNSTQNMNLRILISGVATFVPGGGLDTFFFSSGRIELYRQHRPVFASFPQGYASSYFAQLGFHAVSKPTLFFEKFCVKKIAAK